MMTCGLFLRVSQNQRETRLVNTNTHTHTLTIPAGRGRQRGRSQRPAGATDEGRQYSRQVLGVANQQPSRVAWPFASLDILTQDVVGLGADRALCALCWCCVSVLFMRRPPTQTQTQFILSQTSGPTRTGRLSQPLKKTRKTRTDRHARVDSAFVSRW
jgi:hypothetical protein